MRACVRVRACACVRVLFACVCACVAGVIIGSGIGGVEFFEDNCNKFTAANGGAAGLKKVYPGRGSLSL